MKDAVETFGRVNRPVVIRDHSYSDYIGVPFVWPAPDVASLDAALEPLGPMRELVVVRNPISTFRSLRTHPHYLWCLDGPKFVEGALRFHKHFRDQETMKYEDFILDADGSLRKMCTHYGMDYSESWRSGLSLAVLGSGHPEALASTTVRRPDDHHEDWANHLAEMRRSPLFEELMFQSGYQAAV